MNKLSFLLAVLVWIALPTSFAVLRAEDKPSPGEAEKMLKVVVHVNFADHERQGHGLKNVENILKDAHGKAEVEVVCHGEGVALLVKSQSKHAEKVAALMKQGVRFAACENTMRDKSISKADLLAGAATVPSGAMEVVRKQQEGFSYFKP